MKFARDLPKNRRHTEVPVSYSGRPVPSAGKLKNFCKSDPYLECCRHTRSGGLRGRASAPHVFKLMAYEVKMSKYLPATLGIAAILIASTALAQKQFVNHNDSMMLMEIGNVFG